MVAIIESFCEENSIEYRAYSATEIKKFATGKGNANKESMIESARSKYQYSGNDDNEADAIHLYHLALRDLK
jgi:Holliday junction resolvasome RuvABC endonuclease subunit